METNTYDNAERCKFAGTHLIPVDRLKPSKYQARHEAFEEVDDIENLAESIQSVGLIEMPSVRRVSDENGAFSFEIVTGHRRVRAVTQYLGWKQIKCKVYDDMDEFTAFGIALTENVQRANLSPYEEGMSYVTCQRIFGLSDSQLAEQLHRSIATITSRKQFAKSANNCVKYLSESEAGLFLRNYTFGHYEELAQIKEISQIRNIVHLVKDGVTVKELKSVIAHSKHEPTEKEEGVTSRIRGRSNKALLMNRLHSEIEHLKEVAPDEFRSRIYLLEDMVDEIISWDRRTNYSTVKFQPREEEDGGGEKPARKFACPNCGKMLEVERQLDEKKKLVLFMIHNPEDEKMNSLSSVVEFPRIP